MKYIKDNVENNELKTINKALVKFDNFLQNVLMTPTDEHVCIYEHWVDCMGDIQNIIITEK